MWLFKSAVYKFSFKFQKANVLQEIVTRVKVQYTVEVQSLLLQYYNGNSLFKSILPLAGEYVHRRERLKYL